MIVRIVKMTFKPESCDDFLALFRHYKERIRAAEGCCYLELLRMTEGGNVFFTYSYWSYEADLEKYRQSAIFSEVWPKTKALFESPAEAWTTERVVELK